ncbi:MAG TPA: hypothetical protein VKG86_07445 [Terracidiphilus sp.]|nr:hypothetical protein [Terracidiphilus sp.]
MKFSFAGIAILAAAGIVALSSAAQTTTLQTPAQQPATQAAPLNPQPGGQVIFSRSTDENGQTTTQSTQPVAQPATQTAAAPKASLAPPQVAAEDAERQAVTFTDFDLDVRLRTDEQHIAVRALLTVRNDGKTPLVHIPLEISSSLNWERIRVNGKDVAFPVATLNSDADHTGQLHEAAVALSQPLAPGAGLQLDVTYSGAIAASAQRLLVIGTPDDVALHSDWDRISVPFTGLRGFGNVVWYPVSSVPVILGDGARLFDEIGEHKLRLAGARFRLRLTVEFPRGQAPTVALINGHPVALAVTESGLDQSQEVAGVATADTGGTTLGFEAPSLFVAIRTPHPGANTTVFALPEDETAVEAWTTAATEVTPFLQGWLGQRPHSQLTLLDLPDPQDAPFETGALLATAIRQASPDQLEGFLIHALARARMNSPQSPNSPQQPAWLSEGVATFMVTMWLEKQHGRDQALIALETGRAALALAEPTGPGESAGQPLALAISPVYYRIKAAYVLWMLRDLAGDPALSAALRAYDPAQDFGKGAGPSHTPSAFEKLLEQAGVPSDGSSSSGRQADSRRDLAWFFADWVNADKGLPDLSIAGVFPTSTSAGNWLVAVNVANNGYAQAEVPVTVRTGSGSGATSVTQRILVPARGKAVQRILIQGKPTEVRVNDGTVPETQASVHVTSLDQPAEGSSSSSQSSPLQP